MKYIKLHRNYSIFAGTYHCTVSQPGSETSNGRLILFQLLMQG